ncbi:MAG: NUDIX domain-containing protein [Candidatus Buchananbacteria bacterium]
MPKKDFYQVSLKIILKNSQDEILILNGHPQGSFAGFYDLPGGRIDKEEFTLPFEQIIKREIAEEIGEIKLIIGSKPVAMGRHLISANKTGASQDIHILYLFFEAQFISGQINISQEHDGFVWQRLSEKDLDQFFVSGILEGMKMYLSGH